MHVCVGGENGKAALHWNFVCCIFADSGIFVGTWSI